MKLSEIKIILENQDQVIFQKPDGTFVPQHFHVTEVGVITKNFIDCGGTVRQEKSANFQLWEAGDFDHRLAPQKLIGIIALSEKVLGMEDLDIEVEYQSDTIGKYDLEFNGEHFVLKAKNTACLASDSCGAPAGKQKLVLSELSTDKSACCTPGGGCC
ncbi:MAG: hypothetical protein K0R65_2484 [Crocinitomicaceae bacterium]|jgi:hypothetical protein|nr:hypothetical protein [Crocinitomicaceae bacterium]